jgi:hypothetical protein
MRALLKFDLSHLRGDIYGGLTAGVVAIPLALAFGVASGLGPIAGMYGAIFRRLLRRAVSAARRPTSPDPPARWSWCWRVCSPACPATSA